MFGQTIDGKDVIGQLRVGDVIESVVIENAAEVPPARGSAPAAEPSFREGGRKVKQMNNELFDRANERYRLRDYRGALAAFTECLQDAAARSLGEMGLLYHQIGNCLVKLKKNPREGHSGLQPGHGRYGLSGAGDGGTATSAWPTRRCDYTNAINCFEKSVADDQRCSYKSYMGMGNALMKLGKSAEAGVAFREAALDESNPDPTKALLNLGVCFMALNRPADAVASYESALQFDMQPATRNKLQASLGQAYVACGQMEKAVHAFEEAIADKTYYLSDSASVDYQRAVGAVAQGTSEQNQATQVLQLADMSGLDVAADGTSVYDEGAYEGGDVSEAFYYDEGTYEADPASFPGYVGAYENVDNDRFFTATDAELEQWSRGLAKQDRKRRNVGLKILLFFVIVIVLAAAAGVFAYTQGYGYPTVQTVTQELFSDPSGAADKVFSADVDKDAIPAMLDPVVTDSNGTIDGVSRSMTESTVYATAKTEEGGSVQYRISMVRDGITWKVSNVELYFPSQAKSASGVFRFQQRPARASAGSLKDPQTKADFHGYQQTYSMIKPDGVRNGRIGEIMTASSAPAPPSAHGAEDGHPRAGEANYAEHIGKPVNRADRVPHLRPRG